MRVVWKSALGMSGGQSVIGTGTTMTRVSSASNSSTQVMVCRRQEASFETECDLFIHTHKITM